MLRAHYAGLLLLSCIACGPQSSGLTQAQQSAVSDTIAILVDSFFTANDRGDAAAMMTHYAEREDSIIYDNGRLYTPASYQALWESLFPQLGAVTSQRGQLRVNVLSPEAASVNTPLKYAVITKDARTVNGEAVWTAVFQRQPNGWKIVHSHESNLNLSDFIAQILPPAPSNPGKR